MKFKATKGYAVYCNTEVSRLIGVYLDKVEAESNREFLRLDDKVWEELKKGRTQSGLSWNQFNKHLFDLERRSNSVMSSF